LLIDYSLVGTTGKPGSPTPGAGAPVWSRDFLQPLAPGALSPFSASILHEMGGRGWFNYFDRLGFDPTPKSRVVRSRHGRPYFTLTLSAQLDAQQAGIEPPALRIGGKPHALARWEKPGLLAGLKLGGNARKAGGVLSALGGELDGAAGKGRAWLQRVQTMRWSQAEILQIMEEIERTGATTLELYVAARHHLQSAYLRLLALCDGPATAQQLAAVNAALAPGGDLVELQIARAVASLAQAAQAEPQVLQYLQGGNFAEQEAALAATSFGARLAEFLAAYGHRCAGEGELMIPRWSEDPAPVLAAVVAAAACGTTTLPAPAPPDESPLMALLDGKRRKEAQALLAQIRAALPLQSMALHVHAYTLAGTRVWARAAGREAMSDKRLLAPDDVFLYELEEMKQMMTGEWNVSDREGIQATAVQRRVEWQAAQGTPAADLLVGDGEAFAVVSTGAAGLPGAGGTGKGTRVIAPTEFIDLPNAVRGGKAVLAGVQADVGWALALPVAAGIVQVQGAPLDPLTQAAAALQVPVVYNLGERMTAVQGYAVTALDGSQGMVTDGR
jgi:pyruvate,water dikinase